LGLPQADRTGDAWTPWSYEPVAGPVFRDERNVAILAGLLRGAAAVLVLIGTVEAIIQAPTTDTPALEGGILVLGRILLTLIVAEFAYTLRVVIEKHEISAEPFLFIGLIAVVRRILIVTAEFEQPQTDAQLNNLLLELGMLGIS
jgi:uncharacterized membrane protein (DUF373 family)